MNNLRLCNSVLACLKDHETTSCWGLEQGSGLLEVSFQFLLSVATLHCCKTGSSSLLSIRTSTVQRCRSLSVKHRLAAETCASVASLFDTYVLGHTGWLSFIENGGFRYNVAMLMKQFV